MNIPVCLINNHLASIYNVMSSGENKAKFLTSEDLQYLAALISKHYAENKEDYATNFTLQRGRGIPSTPRFCALPYRIEKEKFGDDFKYSEDYLRRYRKIYESCIERFGQVGKNSRETDEARIKLATRLASFKENANDSQDYLTDEFYEASRDDILEDIKYRDFLASKYSRRMGVSIQDKKQLTDSEKLEWIDSQFYIMRDIPESKREELLNGLMDLYEEYFNSGLPYIFYYQQTRLNPSIGLKLKFGEREKQKFKKAIELAIKDLENTQRPRINNEAYQELRDMTGQAQHQEM